jgi:hypothetical protein
MRDGFPAYFFHVMTHPSSPVGLRTDYCGVPLVPQAAICLCHAHLPEGLHKLQLVNACTQPLHGASNKVCRLSKSDPSAAWHNAPTVHIVVIACAEPVNMNTIQQAMTQQQMPRALVSVTSKQICWRMPSAMLVLLVWVGASTSAPTCHTSGNCDSICARVRGEERICRMKSCRCHITGGGAQQVVTTTQQVVTMPQGYPTASTASMQCLVDVLPTEQHSKAR